MNFAHLIQVASALPTDASDLESSISALEAEIRALETSSVFWEHLLLWFTALVVIGVAMEFWVICRERRDDREAWKRRVIIPPERPSTAKFIIELVSLVLITGGIFGELGVGIEIASINGVLRGKSAELRGKSDQLLALVTQAAGDAAISARNAQISADAASDSARKAQKKADAADASAVHIGELETQLRVEVEEAEVLISASASGHVFRPVLFGGLRERRPANIEIGYPFDAKTETKLFAKKLSAALKDFGWQVSGFTVFNSGPLYRPSGITIFNKWVSFGRQAGPHGPFIETEIDPFYLEYMLETQPRLASEGMTKENVARLTMLSLALDAKAERKPDLGANLLIISIGDGEETACCKK